MPVISSFYGLIIKMYFQQSEHQPKKALAMVKEWVALHRKELLDMWNTQEFKEIKGL